MKKLEIIGYIIVSCLLLSCNNIVNEADSLRLSNKFDEAFALYKEAADNGDSYAKWRLANAYAQGNGVDFDNDMALKYLTEASIGGCEEATCDLARSYMYQAYGQKKDVKKGKQMMVDIATNSQNPYVRSLYAREFLHGWTFEEDKDKAYKILNEIKEKNNEIYLRVMGEVYSIGCNKIDIDYSKAIEYFTKAFNNGSIYSAFILGNLYLNGYKDSKDKKNIPRDIKKAIEWLDKGIEANNTSCMETMSFICRSQDSIYVQYHNIEKGIDLLKKAIRHGSSEAMYKLGKEYQYGENIGKDDEKAFDLYMKSFELNNPNGAFMLGISYMHGIGCEKDVAKGVEVWKKAVEYGDGSSANNLFCYYAYGEFSNDKSVINYELAKKFLKEGAKLGDGMACWNLGRLYYSGNFLFEKNDIQSFIYSKQAADKGIVDACRAVAYMYQQGIGCRKDLEESKKYEEMGKAKEE